MSKRDSLSKEVYTVSEIPFVKERDIRKKYKNRGEKSYFSIKHGEDKPKNNLVGYLQKEGED